VAKLKLNILRQNSLESNPMGAHFGRRIQVHLEAKKDITDDQSLLLRLVAR
jgi:catalase (peroxidase I)